MIDAGRSLRREGAVLAVLLLYLLAYWSTLQTLVDEWVFIGGLYGHGFLVLALSFHSLWQDRAIFNQGSRRSLLLMAMVILGCSLIWWTGEITNTLLVAQLAVYFIFCAVVVGFAGVRQYRYYFVPLVLLAMALPIWGFLQYGLRDMSVYVTDRALGVLGIPFYRYGYGYKLPGGSFVVELTCSGLAFFMTSFVLSVYISHDFQFSKVRRIAFVLTCLALSLVANWLRIIAIMVVGNATHMKSFIATDHLTFGWILYLIILSPLFAWVLLRSRREEHAPPPRAQWERGSTDQKASNYIIIVAALVVIPVLALLSEHLINRQQPVRLALPLMPDMSLKEGVKFPDWSPKFVGADQEVRGRYSESGRQYEVYGAMYNVQHQDKEMIYFANHFFETQRWLKNGSRSESLRQGDDYPVKVLLLHSEDAHKLVAYWYIVAGRQTTSSAVAKLLELKAAVSGDHNAWVMAVSTDYHRATRQQALDDLMEVASELRERVRLVKVDE